mmetsp:Transcript_1467/g.4365  ORF Transcript_1467/g.4365 Transcript_1467/m.4365 type:complete len:107 (+) Transcript_1467:381-701(+)
MSRLTACRPPSASCARNTSIWAMGSCHNHPRTGHTTGRDQGVDLIVTAHSFSGSTCPAAYWRRTIIISQLISTCSSIPERDMTHDSFCSSSGTTMSSPTAMAFQQH